MTAMNEDLVLDANGIPILTELVQEHEADTTAERYEDEPVTATSPAEIADKLLGSKSFRQQLAEISVTLTQEVHQQIEQSLRPAIEQVIVLALEDSDTHAAETVRQQLETALPDLIARALEK